MKKNNKLAIHIEEDPTEHDFPQQHSRFEERRPPTLPDDDDQRNNHETAHHPAKVIEFEEFLVEDEKEGNKNDEQGSKMQQEQPTKAFQQQRTSLRGKREFLIDIPEGKSARAKLVVDSSSLEKDDYKEPPAPSNKKSMKAKNFIFPPAPTQDPKPESNPTPSAEIEDLLRSFDRQRQQFYRQKSNFQKELLVKQGQIEMLQRMLTGRIVTDPAHNYSYFQSLILEKDVQIGELLEKIGELSRQLTARAEQLRTAKAESNRLQNLNESLLHQIYLLERKEANKKTTQQFYQRQRQKPNTPTARNWDNDHLYDKEHHYEKDHLRYPGLCDLQQRIENLKNNRIELEDRKRIKSELNYTQPARFGAYEYKKNKF